MISLADIHRAAYQLLKAHGEYASEYVHDSAIDCLALNDFEGYMHWQRILNVLEGTLPRSPFCHSAVH